MSKCDCSNRLEQIKALYTDLANEPDKDFGWQKGKTNALALGYELSWLETLPMDVWESCAAVGNPFSIGQILPGHTVVDLGCGAGADVCVAALLAQDGGKVIGVDCTRAMVAKTRRNATLCGFTHVDVYEADIAKLPIPDNCADIVISNGAINLSLNKSQVLSEARRVLRPGGRLQIADMIREGTEDDSTGYTNDSWADCVLGTLEAERFLRLIEENGFQQVTLVSKTGYKTSKNTVGVLIRAIK